MYRLTVIYNPPTDPQAFRDYYVSTHLPLVAELPGLRSAQYSFDVAAAEGQSPIFAIWQGDFDSAEAMGAALASAAGEAAVADVPNFATGGVTIVHHAPIAVAGIPA